LIVDQDKNNESSIGKGHFIYCFFSTLFSFDLEPVEVHDDSMLIDSSDAFFLLLHHHLLSFRLSSGEHQQQ
jgi:hypothetical protein